MKRTSVRVERATVKTTDSQVSLKPITLTISLDARFGVLGRNGSGKTTFARLLSGLDKPTSGKVDRGGLRAMHLLQQPEHHFTQDTVLWEIAGYMRHWSDSREGRKYMEAVNLPQDLELVPPRRLSGGQQRLLALACALAVEPDILVLDEPMAELDSESRRLIRDTLLTLKASHKAGLVVISHHPDDLIGLVEELLVLDEGELIYNGAWRSCPLEVLNRCLDPADVSFYRWLRQQESAGFVMPSSIYDTVDVPTIARLLAEA